MATSSGYPTTPSIDIGQAPPLPQGQAVYPVEPSYYVGVVDHTNPPTRASSASLGNTETTKVELYPMIRLRVTLRSGRVIKFMGQGSQNLIRENNKIVTVCDNVGRLVACFHWEEVEFICPDDCEVIDPDTSGRRIKPTVGDQYSKPPRPVEG